MNRTLEQVSYRICMPVAALLLLGLCLIAGGTAHDSVMLVRVGVALFGVGALSLSIVLLATYWAVRR